MDKPHGAEYDEGYQAGFDEARAEWLTKMKKWLARGDTKAAMSERVDYHIEKMRRNNLWPKGW